MCCHQLYNLKPSSGSRAELNDDCNALAKFEVTREKFLEKDEEHVDSTTDTEGTPAKKKRKVSKQADGSSTKSKTVAKALAARGRAISIFKEGQSTSFAQAGKVSAFSLHGDTMSDSETEDLAKQVEI